MSLLRAHGHHDPETYPIGFLIDEAGLVEEREATRMLQEMDLLRQHVASIFSKDTRSHLKRVRDQINVVSRPRDDVFPGSDGSGEGDDGTLPEWDDGPEDRDGG